jgi:hypothetical protein
MRHLPSYIGSVDIDEALGNMGHRVQEMLLDRIATRGNSLVSEINCHGLR